MAEKLIFAAPKGRILKELLPILEQADIIPENDFFDDASRKLRFSTSQSDIDLIRVRSFDVATFIAFGAADLGVVGKDVLLECGYEDLYTPIDLGIGKCRLSVAEPATQAKTDDITHWSHIRIATKYPNITKQFFAQRNIQAECIKLNGAMELAPTLGLCSRIVDLVSTGSTLKANNLEEIEVIADISSYLAINRTSLKTKSSRLKDIIKLIEEACS
tara:strand:- start:444 stop:1094 length:651 start_codon:yes stop_codon:yes gene_type:complete